MMLYFNGASLIACAWHLINNVVQYTQYVVGMSRCCQYIDTDRFVVWPVCGLYWLTENLVFSRLMPWRSRSSSPQCEI